MNGMTSFLVVQGQNLAMVVLRPVSVELAQVKGESWLSLIGQSEVSATLSPLEMDYAEVSVLEVASQGHFYMRYYLLCFVRNGLSPVQSTSRYLGSTGSRNMATQLAHSQDATTGEEIASTTVPQKETPPKRNACTLPPHILAFPALC